MERRNPYKDPEIGDVFIHKIHNFRIRINDVFIYKDTMKPPLHKDLLEKYEGKRRIGFHGIYPETVSGAVGEPDWEWFFQVYRYQHPLITLFDDVKYKIGHWWRWLW